MADVKNIEEILVELEAARAWYDGHNIRLEEELGRDMNYVEWITLVCAALAGFKIDSRAAQKFLGLTDGQAAELFSIVDIHECMSPDEQIDVVTAKLRALCA